MFCCCCCCMQIWIYLPSFRISDFDPTRSVCWNLAETGWKTLFWLNCCERKTLFRLKKEAEQAECGVSRIGPSSRQWVLYWWSGATLWRSRPAAILWIKKSIIWGSLLPIHFNAISIHMHMLMNRLESIYLDIDYPILELPMGFTCG